MVNLLPIDYCLLNRSYRLLKKNWSGNFVLKFVYGVLSVLSRCCIHHLIENSIGYKKDIQHFYIGLILFHKVKSYSQRGWFWCSTQNWLMESDIIESKAHSTIIVVNLHFFCDILIYKYSLEHKNNFLVNIKLLLMMSCRLVLKIWLSSIKEQFVQVPFAISATIAGHPVDIQLLPYIIAYKSTARISRPLKNFTPNWRQNERPSYKSTPFFQV